MGNQLIASSSRYVKDPYTPLSFSLISQSKDLLGTNRMWYSTRWFWLPDDSSLKYEVSVKHCNLDILDYLIDIPHHTCCYKIHVGYFRSCDEYDAFDTSDREFVPFEREHFFNAPLFEKLKNNECQIGLSWKSRFLINLPGILQPNQMDP